MTTVLLRIKLGTEQTVTLVYKTIQAPAENVGPVHMSQGVRVKCK